MTTPQVGAWVRQRIAARKMSIKRVADVAGVSRQTVYDTIKGIHPPSVETQAGMARALGVEPDWYDRLLRGDQPVDLPAARPTDTIEAVLSRLDDLEAAHGELVERVKRLTRDLADATEPGVGDGRAAGS